MLYQLVKNKDGEYFVLELYKDQAALDTHFKNMGAPGAIPLEKIKEGSPLQIYPVVGGFLHEGESTVANIVTLPIAEGKAADFEAATIPALGAFDGEEPGTHAYLLCKKYDDWVTSASGMRGANGHLSYHGTEGGAAFKVQTDDRAGSGVAWVYGAEHNDEQPEFEARYYRKTPPQMQGKAGVSYFS